MTSEFWSTTRGTYHEVDSLLLGQGGQMFWFFSSPFIISDTSNSCDPELPVANMCCTLRPENLWFRDD
ncbi:hypothetical protein B296_00007769 [Ensete ventricosum]|uniref:Uncharacterized protein n=1 Tax=Ensete ventricosum TaxID=4639 RepID=A0A427AQ31_ENSVE|nr:hypothetical protein B296_00007769 [Ensete ventricosum]